MLLFTIMCVPSGAQAIARSSQATGVSATDAYVEKSAEVRPCHHVQHCLI
jgi:multisubunit Na+/H+ antiporter MnhG subunit